MKTTIKEEKQKVKYLYQREGMVASIIADTFTFGLLFGSLAVNRYWLGDHVYIGITFLIMIFIFLIVRGKTKEFHSVEELEAFVKEEKKNESTS